MVDRLVSGGDGQPDRRDGRAGSGPAARDASCWPDAASSRPPASNPPGRGSLSPSSGRAFFVVVFGIVIGLWLCVMIYGSLRLEPVPCRTIGRSGVVMTLLVLAVAFLGWSALETRNSRRGLVTLVLIAVGLKLAHWGYYVPEWNYRYSQGPWARAIAQWIPRKMDPLHLPRLAARPGVLHEAARAAVAAAPTTWNTSRAATASLCCCFPSEFENWPAPPRRSRWSPSFRTSRPESASWLAPRPTSASPRAESAWTSASPGQTAVRPRARLDRR